MQDVLKIKSKEMKLLMFILSNRTKFSAKGSHINMIIGCSIVLVSDARSTLQKVD